MPINNFLLPGAKVTPAYEVANSCRFDGSSAKLTKTQSGTSTNDKKGTFSWWMKRSKVDATAYFINMESGSERFQWYIISSGAFSGNYRGSSGSPDSDLALTGTPLFRDPSAWYHCVLAWDTTQGTQLNRIRFYVNNTEYVVTQSQTIAEDTVFAMNKSSFGSDLQIFNQGTQNYHNGYVAEVVFIDGQQLTPSSFGEYDGDSPTIWKPKDVSGLTFGTIGYYLDFEDSSSLGNDAKGSNNFTATNLAATDQTTDTPTNNFATLNPLMAGRGSTLSEGNLKVTGESDNNYDVATFGSDMKWYYEWKVDENYDGSGGGVRLGAIHIDELSTNDNFSNFATTKVKLYTNSNDGKTQEGPGDNVITSLTRATTDNIIMCACDGTNAKIWWGVNGTWLDYGSGTGDPANGNNSAPWSSNAMASGIYFPVICYSGTAAAGSLNLGNPSFSISSGNADANGYGNFEYSVPSGFYSLCTKNLAEYGG